jgi:hypothetical protein
LITVASTTESPEQIRADLEQSGFAITDETSDVTGQTVESARSTPAAPKPRSAETEVQTGEPGETAAELETASHTDETNAAAATQAADKNKQDRTQKKLLKSIDRATKRWRTEESRAAQLAAENEELRRQIAERNAGNQAPAGQTTAQPATETALETPPTQAASEMAEPVLPRQGDYADWSQYEEALDKYQKDLLAYSREVAKAEVRKEREGQETARQQAEAAEHWANVAKQGRDKYADWDQVSPKPGSAEDIQFAQEVAQVVASSPVAHDLLYHLARHPEDARYLAGLPPAMATRELGRLEAYLERAETAAPAAAAAPAEPVPAAPPQAAQPIRRVPTQSARPTPISPVNPGAASTGASDPGRMTPREYREARRNGTVR